MYLLGYVCQVQNQKAIVDRKNMRFKSMIDEYMNR